MFCNVIVTRPFDQIFTYKLKKDQSVQKGNIVSIPFGKSNNQIGMVESVFKNITFNNNYKIKEVERVFESITLSKNIIKLSAIDHVKTSGENKIFFNLNKSKSNNQFLIYVILINTNRSIKNL